MTEKFEKVSKKTKSNFLSERLMQLKKNAAKHYAEQKIWIWQTGTLSNVNISNFSCMLVNPNYCFQF